MDRESKYRGEGRRECGGEGVFRTRGQLKALLALVVLTHYFAQKMRLGSGETTDC